MNLELVEQIVVLLGDYPVSEIAVESAGTRVHVRRPLSAAGPSLPVPPESPVTDRPDTLASALDDQAEELHVLTAPMVGIFYHAEPPWALGTEIKPGQIAGCIESMKLMNDVPAEVGGRIAEILVEDGAPVEYGQSLFRLSALSAGDTGVIHANFSP